MSPVANAQMTVQHSRQVLARLTDMPKQHHADTRRSDDLPHTICHRVGRIDSCVALRVSRTVQFQGCRRAWCRVTPRPH